MAYSYLKKGYSNYSDEEITCYPIIYATRLIRLALGLLKISVSYTKKKTGKRNQQVFFDNGCGPMDSRDKKLKVGDWFDSRSLI